jgi:hypothetical protein
MKNKLRKGDVAACWHNQCSAESVRESEEHEKSDRSFEK